MENKNIYREIMKINDLLFYGGFAFMLIILGAIVWSHSASDTHELKRLDSAAFIFQNHCRLTSATEYEFEYLCDNQVKFTTSYYEGKDGKQKQSQK